MKSRLLLLSAVALIGGCAMDNGKTGIASASANYGVDTVNQPVVADGKASVPNCPNWDHAGRDSAALTDPNYGCAVNSNLAAMVADANDLVHGRGDGLTDAHTAAVAVKTWHDAKPTSSQWQATTKEASTGGPQ